MKPSPPPASDAGALVALFIVPLVLIFLFWSMWPSQADHDEWSATMNEIYRDAR